MVHTNSVHPNSEDEADDLVAQLSKSTSNV